MSKHTARVLAGAAALAALLAAAPASAHWRLRIHGPAYGHGGGGIKHLGGYVGMGAFAAGALSASGTEVFVEPGGGWSLFVGGRLHPMLSIEGGWRGSLHGNRHDAWGVPIDYLVLHAFTVDAKLHFPMPGLFEPYLQLGAGGYALGHEWEGWKGAGPGFQVGGGFDVWLSSHTTFGGRLLYHGASLRSTGMTRADSTFLSTLTGELNLAFRF